jgi:hypothetical protein
MVEFQVGVDVEFIARDVSIAEILPDVGTFVF